MDQSHHAHPVTILLNLWRVFYLIIIPVLRGFLGALRGDFSTWLHGAWIDLLILLSMVAVAVWRWYRISYSYDDSGLQVTAGVFNRRYTQIPWSNVVTLSVIHSFFLRPFQAVRLRADTLGGSFKDADFTILLRPKRAEALMAELREPARRAGLGDYSPSIGSILALSLLNSNSFVGIVFIATFISQAGRLLGNEFSHLLIGTVEEVARTLAIGIPPAATVLAGLMLAGWFVAFLLTFIRHKNIVVSRRASTLQVAGGLFTRRDYCIAAGDVNLVDIRQSLFTKLFRLYSLYIYAVGYGKQKNDISCMIPAEGAEDFRRHRRLLFPAFEPVSATVRPARTGFMRFIAQPLIPCCSIPLAMGVLVWFFPGWRTFILFVGLMSMVPSAVFLVVRLLDFLSGGVGFDGKNYTLRYSKGFTLHTVIIPREKIVLLDFRQSLFQRHSDKCDLFLHTESEGRSIHLCRNLDREALVLLFFGRAQAK